MSNRLSNRRGRLSRPVICDDKRVLFLEPEPVLAPDSLLIRFFWSPPEATSSFAFEADCALIPGSLTWAADVFQHNASLSITIEMDPVTEMVVATILYNVPPYSTVVIESPPQNLIAPSVWWNYWRLVHSEHFNDVHELTISN